jgi:hypothetical protein
MPIAWNWLSRSGPQVAWLHSLPLTVFPVTVAKAPSLTWIPFWAIAIVEPAPVTVFPVIVPIEPAPRTVIPFFW